MSNIKLFVDRPLLLLLLIPALALMALPWLRIHPKRRRSFPKLAPLILHGLIAVLLVLTIAQTAIVRTTDSQAVMLVVDLSDSTASVHDAIKEKAAEIQSLIQGDTTVGVVAFGKDCIYATSPKGLRPVKADGSDLSAALQYAYSQLPSQRAGRIIVLSDGKQTDPDADSTAQYLQSQGIRIDGVYYDIALLTGEAQLNALNAPENVYAGKDIPLTAEIRCNTYTDASLSLYDNDALIETRDVKLTVGSNMIPLSAPASDVSSHTYRLVMSSQKDTLSQNNEAFAHVSVTDKPSVLLITGTNAQTEPLQALLAEKNHITVISPKQAPRDIIQLCDYDGIVLCNVDARDLPKHYGNLLEVYVNKHGRSLLALGGDNTFMYGGMKDTILEEMMPVQFSLSRSSEDDPVALMLVMDCSLSMSQQSTYMSVSKQGAIKCIEAMTDNDYVGVISFNRTAVVEAPLEKNTRAHKDKLNRIVSGLVTSQGTYYTDALKLAHEQLQQSQASVKHVLFVSDGSPADTTYQDLIPQMVADGISISTVGLGYSSVLLEDMASTSGGQYYYVDESSDLPDIMLTLTKQISVNSLITGSFAPVFAEDPMTQDLGQLPPVHGYLGTTVKEGAQAPITTQDSHPIYATWQYGAGRVSCVTTDLCPQWCSLWLEDANASALTERIMAFSLSETHKDSAMSAQWVKYAKSAQLSVHTGQDGDYNLSVTVEDQTYPMNLLQPGVYTASIPTPDVGIYPVQVHQFSSDGKQLDTLDAVICANWSPEYDAFAPSGQALMNSICSYCGGVVTQDAKTLADIRVESVQVVFDFMPLFATIIFACLLADIAIRRLRWKDIKNLWQSLKAP